MKDLLFTLLQAVVVAVIPVICTYVCKFLYAKKKEAQTSIDNETAAALIAEAFEAVTTAVIATNQTYVDTLKRSDKFTVENQKEAFQRAYDTAQSLMRKEVAEYITLVYGSLSDWLTANIEAQVNLEKRPE